MAEETKMGQQGEPKAAECRIPLVKPMYDRQEAEEWFASQSGQEWPTSVDKKLLFEEEDWRHVIDDHDDDVAEQRWLAAQGLPEVLMNPDFTREGIYRGRAATYFVGTVQVEKEKRKTVLLMSTGGTKMVCSG